MRTRPRPQPQHTLQLAPLTPRCPECGHALWKDERLDNVGKNRILVRAGAYKNGTLADLKPLTSEDATLIRKHLGARLVGVAEVQVTQRVASTRTHNHAT